MLPTEEEIAAATKANPMFQALDQFPWLWDTACMIFVGGALLLAFHIRKENGFNIFQTLMCLVGLKRYQRNGAINLAHFFALGAPLALVVIATLYVANS